MQAHSVRVHLLGSGVLGLLIEVTVGNHAETSQNCVLVPVDAYDSEPDKYIYIHILLQHIPQSLVAVEAEC